MKDLQALFVLTPIIGLTGFALFYVLKLRRTVSDLKKLNEELEIKINKQEQIIIHSSKMKTLGEMACGIAHEINTPLGIISLKTSQLRSLIQKNNYTKALEAAESINSTVFRIDKIIRGLRWFAKDGSNSPLEETELYSIISDTLSLCLNRFKKNNIHIEMPNSSNPIFAECRPVQVSQALLNLLNNAFDAIKDLNEKWVTINISENADFVLITVTDSGLEIPQDLQDKMMQPFYSTKGLREGLGLGLSISKGLIESQNGFLKYNKDSRNTQFIIELLKPKHRRMSLAK